MCFKFFDYQTTW